MMVMMNIWLIEYSSLFQGASSGGDCFDRRWNGKSGRHRADPLEAKRRHQRLPASLSPRIQTSKGQVHSHVNAPPPGILLIIVIIMD
jgi:hypothetical protein